MWKCGIFFIDMADCCGILEDVWGVRGRCGCQRRVTGGGGSGMVVIGLERMMMKMC